MCERGAPCRGQRKQQQTRSRLGGLNLERDCKGSPPAVGLFTHREQLLLGAQRGLAADSTAHLFYFCYLARFIGSREIKINCQSINFCIHFAAGCILASDSPCARNSAVAYLSLFLMCPNHTFPASDVVWRGGDKECLGHTVVDHPRSPLSEH